VAVEVSQTKCENTLSSSSDDVPSLPFAIGRGGDDVAVDDVPAIET